MPVTSPPPDRPAPACAPVTCPLHSGHAAGTRVARWGGAAWASTHSVELGDGASRRECVPPGGRHEPPLVVPRVHAEDVEAVDLLEAHHHLPPAGHTHEGGHTALRGGRLRGSHLVACTLHDVVTRRAHGGYTAIARRWARGTRRAAGGAAGTRRRHPRLDVVPLERDRPDRNLAVAHHPLDPLQPLPSRMAATTRSRGGDVAV